MRGDVEFPQRALEDFICVKGNGKPLFVLANAVDDRAMAITHVIRGEDQLPTTPRQIMLWGALERGRGPGLELPTYAHLPLLVNERGKKLSKRRDPVAVEMYREQGYLAEAFRNYLALLGWSPGDDEIVPVETSSSGSGWRTCSARRPSSTSRSCPTSTASTSVRSRWTSFVAAARPWVDPVPGEWAPGSWRDPDTGAPATEPPPWRPSASTRPCSPRWQRSPRSGWRCWVRCPGWSTSSSWRTRPSTRRLAEGDRRRRAAPVILGGALAAYETCPWDKDALHEVTLGSPTPWDASWARHRHRSAWPSWEGPGAATLRLAGGARP